MELKVDLQHQVENTVGSLEPSHLWVLGLALDDEGSLIGPGLRPYSYWAECDCPDDCLRDHGNE